MPRSYEKSSQEQREVKAMGLKFAGLEVSPDLWINDMWPVHHDGGDAWEMNNILLYKCCKESMD